MNEISTGLPLKGCIDRGRGNRRGASERSRKEWLQGHRPARSIVLTVVVVLALVQSPLARSAMKPDAPVATPAQPGLPVLTNISAVRQLSPVEAARGYPVRVRGVATYCDRDGTLFVQDTTAGIWVDHDNSQLDLRHGQQLELEGVSGRRDFAPIFKASSVRVLGVGAEPPAQPVRLVDLLTGDYDSQWVQFEGVVRSMANDNGHLVLSVASRQGNLKALFATYSKSADSLHLVDAHVRVRGACASEFNQRGQLIYIHLMVPDLACLEIGQSGAPDPFALPVRQIGDLFRFEDQNGSDHLVHLEGTVTLYEPGKRLVLQNDTDGLLVESDQPDRLQPGDRIDVVGFPAGGGYAPHLDYGRYRKRGQGPLPQPLRVRASQILSYDSRSPVLDARLMQLQGRLVSSTISSDQEILLVEADSQTFNAVLSLPDAPEPRRQCLRSLASVRSGSLLEFTGVGLQQLDSDHVLHSFELHLRSPDDVRVLEAASWWTLGHSLGVVGTMGFAILVAVTWITSLRYQLRRQTAAVQRSEEHYRQLVNGSPDMIFINHEGKIAYVNPAGLRLLGAVRPDQVVDKAVMDLIHPEYRQIVAARIATGGPVPQLEEKYMRLDGSEVDVEVTAIPMTFDNKPAAQVIVRDVTQRKRTYDSLCQSQERLSLALEAAAMGVWEWNIQSNGIFWSPECYEIMGVDRCEGTLASFTDSVHPEDATRVKQAMDKALTTRSTYAAEFRILRPHGQVRWLANVGRAHYDADGKPLRMIGTVQDITERRAAEESLRLLGSAVQQSTESIMIAEAAPDPLDAKIVFVNPAFTQMRGYSAEEVVGKTPRILVRPTTDPTFLSELRQALAREEAFRGELAAYRKDGSELEVDWVIAPIRNPAGVITHLVASQRDVTRRMRAEKALRESEEKFRQITENIDVVFWLASPDMQKFYYVSPAYERIWGRSVESLYADPNQWCQAVPDGDRPRVLAELSKLGGEQYTISVEFPILRPNGLARWLHGRGFKLEDDTGKTTRYVGIVTDVTERREAEAKMAALHRELVETSRQAGMAEVASSVLHNVGNVLNSANVSSSLAVEKIRNSKVQNLGKVAGLIQDHLHDLPAFLADDPKGKQLPKYLSVLAAHRCALAVVAVWQCGSAKFKFQARSLHRLVSPRSNNGCPDSTPTVQNPWHEDVTRLLFNELSHCKGIHGLSWSNRVSGTEDFLSGVTYGNNQFVAVGAVGTIVTSPDGIAWTNRTSGTARGPWWHRLREQPVCSGGC
jgi:PAS domain S-box-containing protein